MRRAAHGDEAEAPEDAVGESLQPGVEAVPADGVSPRVPADAAGVHRHARPHRHR